MISTMWCPEFGSGQGGLSAHCVHRQLDVTAGERVRNLELRILHATAVSGRATTAGESKGMSETSLSNSDNSSMGVACVGSAPAGCWPLLLLFSHLLVHLLLVLLLLCTSVALCHP